MQRVIVLFSVLLLGWMPAAAGTTQSDAPSVDPVAFMRGFVEQVNPSLVVEDEYCVNMLPWAIHRYAQARELDWRKVFVLAWQESTFDCHAKNRRDRGGAYGPFQIRRLWEPLIGDPRHRYFDPELAVIRVTRVLEYYQDTERYEELVKRRFIYPLMCLYNTGETQRVNMRYCRQITDKMDTVDKAWTAYQKGETLVAMRQ